MAQETLDQAGITLNRNTIPDDPRSAFVTSGLRLGTAAVTTAGMGVAEMGEVADLMVAALKSAGDDSALADVRGEVNALCAKFPPYPDLAV
jgi:glycine hydroxymethyltransferase